MHAYLERMGNVCRKDDSLKAEHEQAKAVLDDAKAKLEAERKAKMAAAEDENKRLKEEIKSLESELKSTAHTSNMRRDPNAPPPSDYIQHVITNDGA